jgi:hypothetical protein
VGTQNAAYADSDDKSQNLSSDVSVIGFGCIESGMIIKVVRSHILSPIFCNYFLFGKAGYRKRLGLLWINLTGIQKREADKCPLEEDTSGGLNRLVRVIENFHFYLFSRLPSSFMSKEPTEIIGYAEPWIVSPGEIIEIKVDTRS